MNLGALPVEVTRGSSLSCSVLVESISLQTNSIITRRPTIAAAGPHSKRKRSGCLISKPPWCASATYRVVGGGSRPTQAAEQACTSNGSTSVATHSEIQYCSGPDSANGLPHTLQCSGAPPGEMAGSRGNGGR